VITPLLFTRTLAKLVLLVSRKRLFFMVSRLILTPEPLARGEQPDGKEGPSEQKGQILFLQIRYSKRDIPNESNKVYR